MPGEHSTLHLVLDLTGTLAFALSGSTLAIERKLDALGVVVLSFSAALGGGIVRDLLIGAVPPPALQDWRYLAVVLCAGVLTYFWYPYVKRGFPAVTVFDAIGLGFFAVLGAQKALSHGVSPSGAVLLGVMTGVGGGTIRDVLVSRIPTIFTGEIYALAALLSAVIVVGGHFLELPAPWVAGVAIFAGTLLRLYTYYRRLHLPLAARDSTL